MSAVEGADTTAAVRARLEEGTNDPATVDLFRDALLAVLEELDAFDEMGWSGGNPELAFSVQVIRRAIASALGVQREGTP